MKAQHFYTRSIMFRLSSLSGCSKYRSPQLADAHWATFDKMYYLNGMIRLAWESNLAFQVLRIITWYIPFAMTYFNARCRCTLEYGCDRI